MRLGCNLCAAAASSCSARYQGKRVGYDSDDYHDVASRSEAGVQGKQETPLPRSEHGELSRDLTASLDSISMWRESDRVELHVRHRKLGVRRCALTLRWESPRSGVAL